MTNSQSKLRGLVEAIYIQTAQDNIKWKLSTSNDRVLASVAGYQVEISEEPSNGGFEQDIRYTIYNENGDQIDTFSDTIFSDVYPINVDLKNYYSLMSDTLEMARRQASGADKAIASLLDALGGSPITEKGTRQENSDDWEGDVIF